MRKPFALASSWTAARPRGDGDRLALHGVRLLSVNAIDITIYKTFCCHQSMQYTHLIRPHNYLEPVLREPLERLLLPLLLLPLLPLELELPEVDELPRDREGLAIRPFADLLELITAKRL